MSEYAKYRFVVEIPALNREEARVNMDECIDHARVIMGVDGATWQPVPPTVEAQLEAAIESEGAWS